MFFFHWLLEKIMQLEYLKIFFLINKKINC